MARRGDHLVAKVAHVNVDDVGGGLEVVVPDSREYLLSGEDCPPWRIKYSSRANSLGELYPRLRARRGARGGLL